MTEAVAVLREIQNQGKDELYIYSEYDPKFYFPKLLCRDTFASQIRCQLYTALQEHNRLPAVILLIIGNKDVDHKVLNPECTRKVWSALFTEIQRTIRTRKEDLPSKSKNVHEPRVLIANMFPRFKNHNDALDLTKETFKTKRRRFNGILPQVANTFNYKVMPITGIIPDSTDYFTVSTGQLNGKGMKEYWTSVSRELKVQDVRFAEQKKSKIIQEYFDNQREQRRLALEKRKAENERSSLQNSNNQNFGDRGDGNFIRGHRASSVPIRKNTHRKY